MMRSTPSTLVVFVENMALVVTGLVVLGVCTLLVADAFDASTAWLR